MRSSINIATRRCAAACPVIAAGVPELAAWGLWRGMTDPSFDVRYHCGMVLARLAATVQLGPLAPEEVFDYVRKELVDAATRCGGPAS